MQAAEAFGLSSQDYFALSRENRLIMTAYTYGKGLLVAMQSHDSIEESKKKK
jgi:hypothetical protein